MENLVIEKLNASFLIFSMHKSFRIRSFIIFHNTYYVLFFLFDMLEFMLHCRFLKN